MKEHGFGKDFRLRSNDDFKRVICQRRKSSDGLLTVYAAENDKGYARIGVSVGKHIGSAVVRNRIKRLIREAFRRAREEVPRGFDYVVIAGKRARQEASLEKIRESLICLSGNANKKTQIS